MAYECQNKVNENQKDKIKTLIHELTHLRSYETIVVNILSLFFVP